MIFNQSEFDLRCEWGIGGVMQLAPISDVVVIFQMFRTDIASALSQCSSGKELISRGFSRDLELATALNVSECIPICRDRAYSRHV